VFLTQAKLLSVALDRVDESLGGARFEGWAVDSRGLLQAGTMVLVGPSAIFVSNSGAVIGSAEARLGSLEPAIIPFGKPEDAAAVAEFVANGGGLFPLDPTLGNAHLVEKTEETLAEHIQNGGPVMIPIALCSVIALAYIVERSVRLRDGELGSRSLGRRVLAALRSSGPDDALAVCAERPRPLTRILAAGLTRAGNGRLELEKAVEDAGVREVKRLSANLKPLVVVGMIAPLLGLLGTVWGMIEAFSSIALEGGLGRPELLASGISQALITTAAGLTIAIQTQAAYYWFKGRIERFARRTEDLYLELEASLERRPAPALESGALA
jgi:biopolymer transport protein ExbB